jgi:predicted unusual protein kinase regulating ubiquinone biosynthesis (AarF/ABC1/UbiB family)
MPRKTPPGEAVRVPRGRFGRMARLVGAAGGMVFRAGSNEDAAAQAAKVLGNLRGLAAKIGQMASYVDGLVPEEKRDAFEASLKVLRAAAPRSAPNEIRALVESELRAPIDRLFAEWNDVPIASASIGQVHRARLAEEVGGGIEVAVKVQHPGIRAAVESDLSSAGILEGLGAMLGGRRFDTKGNLEVMRTRFREELDYRLEAERGAAFATIHEGDARIVVPRVIGERSSASVLTTELVSGRLLEEILDEPEEARRTWGETLWRFTFKGNLVGGMFNADPHPGNYLFQEEGRIAFLDYGCVQVLPPSRGPIARATHRAALAGDEAAFAASVSRLLGTRPGELERLARAYTRLCFEPLFGSPYRITRPYAASLVATMKSMALEARKLPASEVFSMPPEMLFMNRLQFGFYSVLARLDVAIDYAAVERGFLPAEG